LSKVAIGIGEYFIKEELWFISGIVVVSMATRFLVRKIILVIKIDNFILKTDVLLLK
jgi:hypothetical protein